jgi:general secretion pathway protein B
MSYILDALKKAERERGLASVPTIEAIHELPKGNHSGRWIALGLLFLSVLMVLGLFYASNRRDSRSPVSETLEASPSPVQTAPLFIPAVVPSQTLSPKDTLALSPDKTAERTDVTASSSTSEMNRYKPKPEMAAKVLSTKQVEPSSPESIENASQVKIPMRNGESASLPVQAKPRSLQDAMAGMNMSIHLYSENRAERMVFINGRKCFEGDLLEPDVFLESITAEGVVLRSGKERAVLRQSPR